MQRILVPIDFSDVTNEVVREAAALARAFDGVLWLIHVAPPDPDFVGYEVGPKHVRDQVAAKYRKEHRRLQRLAEHLQGSGIPTTALLVQGPTVETLVAEAAKLNVEVIVVGSHGRGALSRALLGSVSEGLSRKGPCPLLIIPARLTRRGR
jgi:nucleotide-binding universal stress UspA family protein